MATYTTPDIYDDYIDSSDEPLEEDIFKSLCESFNKKVMNKIIYEGRPFEMGNFLSAIEIVRIKRDFSRKVVNWNKSYELKEELESEGKELYDADSGEGHKWLVYYTDPFYCRFRWVKSHVRIPNKEKYKFIATRGAKGNKTKLKDFLRKDELNHTKYKRIE